MVLNFPGVRATANGIYFIPEIETWPNGIQIETNIKKYYEMCVVLPLPTHTHTTHRHAVILCKQGYADNLLLFAQSFRNNLAWAEPSILIKIQIFCSIHNFMKNRDQIQEIETKQDGFAVMIQLGRVCGGWVGWHQLPISSSLGLDQ